MADGPAAGDRRHTRIPLTTVHDYHKRLSVRVEQIAKPAARTVTRGGKSYTMDRSAMGKVKPKALPPPEADALLELADGDVPSSRCCTGLVQVASAGRQRRRLRLAAANSRALLAPGAGSETAPHMLAPE